MSRTRSALLSRWICRVAQAVREVAGVNPASEGDARDVESGGYRGLGGGCQCFPHEVCDVGDEAHVE